MANITGVRVIDVSGAHLCIGLLRTMGADVLTIDEGDGDFKPRAGLELAVPGADALELQRCIAAADVLVDGLGRNACDAYGVPPARLPMLNPRLIHCSIAAEGDAPLESSVSVIAQLAELYAYQQILLLLFERRLNGRGRHVAIKVHGAIATQLDASVPTAWVAGMLSSGGRPSIRGLELCTLPTRDGLVVFSPEGFGQRFFDERRESVFRHVAVADAVRLLDQHGIVCGGISHVIDGVSDIGDASDLRTGSGDPADGLASHAAARWARAVVQAIDAPRDPKTIAAWGRVAAAAPGTLKNWCRTAGFSPRLSLAFARVLRAILWRQKCGRRPEDLLDCVDRRTLAGLLKLGVSHDITPTRLPDTVEEFFQKQQWIADPVALREVEAELQSRHITVRGSAEAARHAELVQTFRVA